MLMPTVGLGKERAPSIHKLDAITDRKTQKFRGFYKLESKRKIKNSLR